MLDAPNLTNYLASLSSLQEKFAEYPRMISIETLVRCNATCSFCPYPASPRQEDRMDDDLFHKILEDLQDIPKDRWIGVNLSRINEPLLDRRLRDFSFKIQEVLPKAAQMIFSNGTMLTPEACEWIADLPRAELRISLNSVHPADHKAMMGISFDKVMRNLDALHVMKEAGKFPPPVRLNGMYLSPGDADNFVAFCRERFPQFEAIVRPFFVWQGNENAGEAEQKASGLHGRLRDEILDLPCGQWFDLNILANGFATKCCIDEAGFTESDFDLRQNHALEVYARSRKLRAGLPSRQGVKGCESCLHLG